MNSFKNLPFKVKLVTPILLLAALFLTSSLIGYFVSKSLTANTLKISDGFLPEINYLLQADRDLYQAQIAERTILFLPDGDKHIGQYKDQYLENIGQAKDRVAKFFQSANEPSLKNYANTFNDNYNIWVNQTKKVVEDKAAGRAAVSDVIQFMETSEKSFQAMRTVIDEVGELRINAAKAYSKQTSDKADSSQSLLLIVLAAGLLICACCALLIPPMVVKPMLQLRDRLKNIATGEGDLTARITLNQKDEIGSIVKHFNHFMEKLQTLIGQTQQITDTVAQQTQALGKDASANKDANEHQLEALTLVATAVNEMASAIQEVARNTADAADEAKTASSQSEHGQRTVYETIAQIQLLSEQVQSAAGLIAHVEEEANKVNSVIDVIGGIAEQTNLLALNAAIEAARAGEQGRGFAVVADEVRTLASRTQESTQDIQRMLQKLQQGVKDAVSAMDTSRDSAQETVKTTEGAGKTLDEVKDAVTNITRMVIQIAAAAEEQSEVTEDINRNLTQIQGYAETNTQIAEKTLTTSNNLYERTETLRKSVRSFKVS
ncbi:methyl-accepting chemotaxis protein [Ketobacter alkanivorans]|nr:methyl-accepting chemotaxis protein [Ketobacter alkanivorans]